MSIIVGINAYHGDSSACLLKDGDLVAAAEEERFRRIKHWAGFPSKAISYCLSEAGIELDSVDHIAVNTDPKANILQKILFALKQRPDIALIIDRLKNKSEKISIEKELRESFLRQKFSGKVHYVEHHYSHLASAFLVSPYEKSIVVSVDGFGDFASAAWGIGENSEINIENRVCFPHSLGIFYQALTQYLGFPHYGDEYKVMGLAPYGQPNYLAQMRQIVGLKNNGGFRLNLKYFRHHKEKIEYEWSNGSPHVGRLHSKNLEELLGPARGVNEELTQKHKDIARSIQAMYEEAFFHLINTLYDRHGIESLCVAGGCGMNSVANGRIYYNTNYKKVYIQSAAGDAGGAIGAAFSVATKYGEVRKRFLMDHAYWGPEFSSQDIEELINEKRDELSKDSCNIRKYEKFDELAFDTARHISEGSVIGWFQGRMEWGPRALGNRSILGDPRRTDMKDILNLKIKRRESFRPFAPSILRESVSDWFEQDDDVPFMMKVFQIKEDKRNRIPAVTHADGSGRLQTVYEQTNSRYYQLIKSFYERTGVPIILNTSFNENEPVVCRPDEALACFLRTKMDVLVLGDWMISRETT
ncbi:MAG: carbamoyltransferase [Gammaproteobacteria bacterium]